MLIGLVICLNKDIYLWSNNKNRFWEVIYKKLCQDEEQLYSFETLL